MYSARWNKFIQIIRRCTEKVFTVQHNNLSEKAISHIHIKAHKETANEFKLFGIVTMYKYLQLSQAVTWQN